MNNVATQYQKFIATSRYAKWLEEEQRRESSWEETTTRYIEFFKGLNYPSGNSLSDVTWDNLYQHIVDMDTMPSMRCVMTAGEALARDHVAGYNCSYLALEGTGASLDILTDEMKSMGFEHPITIRAQDPRAFDEMMYVLLCGTGVGFSVERQFIASLPVVGHALPRSTYARTDENFPGVAPEDLSTYARNTRTIHVADTKYGWASALRILLVELYNGNFEVKWNTDKIRPAGERLKTFGGRASGPEPLVRLFNFAVNLFKDAQGRRLTSLEAHDLACMVADIVVVGGVRRSALLSLSNLTDQRMRGAKSGAWYEDNPQRALANNSSCYTERPDMGIFIREWESLYESKSGERGIFSRPAAQRIAKRNGRRVWDVLFGTNPCSEIILRSMQFCNLSEIVARPQDTIDDLKRKARVAAILGTIQSSLTEFKYLNPEWRRNTEEERLLGVSITGIMDHPILSGRDCSNEVWAKFNPAMAQEAYRLEDVLEELRDVVIVQNKKTAHLLGIRKSAAATCVKPSGTVSQLVNSASGIHPRYSEYYIRTVRCDKKDPIYDFLKVRGVPVEDDLMKPETGAVFSFPIASPEGAITRDDTGAIEQLELWKVYAEHWCEHKPSITVYYKEHEALDVGAWVYKNFDEVSGISFLPYSGHIYPQAPYQPIDKEEYDKAVAAFPVDINWEELSLYETEDNSTVEHELACSAGGCELI